MTVSWRRCLTPERYRLAATNLSFSEGFVIVYSSRYTVRITFAHDKRAGKAHYKVRHANIREGEFEEVLSRPVVVFGQRRRVLKAVGRTVAGRFLTVVFIRVSSDHYHVITGWPSNRRQILIWHREWVKR
jgi:hypothetical protein